MDKIMSDLKKTDPSQVSNKHLNLAWNILKSAIDEVPAIKYVLGVVALAAAVSLIGALVLYNWLVAFVGGIIVFFATIAIIAFANIAKLGRRVLRTPALILTWISIILTSGAASLLFSSVFLWLAAYFKTLV